MGEGVRVASLVLVASLILASPFPVAKAGKERLFVAKKSTAACEMVGDRAFAASSWRARRTACRGVLDPIDAAGSYSLVELREYSNAHTQWVKPPKVGLSAAMRRIMTHVLPIACLTASIGAALAVLALSLRTVRLALGVALEQQAVELMYTGVLMTAEAVLLSGQYQVSVLALPGLCCATLAMAALHGQATPAVSSLIFLHLALYVALYAQGIL